MPRKNLIRSNSFPYHITGRGNNREVFPCTLHSAWLIFGANLREINALYQAQIHAFVLMPNHFHLLITTPKEDIGVAMQTFMSSSTKTINTLSGRSGRVFGARYHWSLVNNLSYFEFALKYLYRNPVKAGLTKNVEDYAFSSLNGALGVAGIPFPLHPIVGYQTLVPVGNKSEYLAWLNQPFRDEQYKAIKSSLRKSEFALSKVGYKRVPVDLNLI